MKPIQYATIPLLGLASLQGGEQTEGKILTPPPSPSPRVNGPAVFGVTPGNPVVYSIPASGKRPITYLVEGLPPGLQLDSSTGLITGVLKHRGKYPIVIVARNDHGEASRRFTLVCGDEISLTPPMGWNSWNCWGISVDQDKILRAGKALVEKGLSQHGWSYVNIDDGWQGARGGQENAIQPNEKFSDMHGLAHSIHELGLRFGIYSTPWITSYGNMTGGTSNDPRGAWTRVEGGWNDYSVNHHQGTHSFAPQDARQFAAWGVDYLKYDWFPNNLEHTRDMALALRDSGRDIHYSLSNTTSLKNIAELQPWANSWRTTGDIGDEWEKPAKAFEHSVTEIGFNQDRWHSFQRPGHFNDADMLVLGQVGWGPTLRATHLSPAEQYSHFSLWCMLSGPLLLGCDLDQLDDFTLGLLTNDEVLAVNQDTCVTPALRVGSLGTVDVLRKDLEDGTIVLGFFNRGNETKDVSLKINELELNGLYTVRDLWRQRDVGECRKDLPMQVEPHGVMLVTLKEKKL